MRKEKGGGRGGRERRKESASKDISCPSHVALDSGSEGAKSGSEWSQSSSMTLQQAGANRILTESPLGVPCSRSWTGVVEPKWRPFGRRMSLRAIIGSNRDNATGRLDVLVMWRLWTVAYRAWTHIGGPALRNTEPNPKRV